LATAQWSSGAKKFHELALSVAVGLNRSIDQPVLLVGMLPQPGRDHQGDAFAERSERRLMHPPRQRKLGGGQGRLRLDQTLDGPGLRYRRFFG
jgi:hypothetical protein